MGSAIYFVENSNANLIDCNFTNNKANNDNGAVYFNSGFDGILTNCKFANNSGKYSGVEPVDPVANITIPDTANVGQTFVASIELPNDATGNVSVFVDGKEVASVCVINGTVSLPISGLSSGSHVVEVKYSGDDKYTSASSVKSVNVAKIDTVITVDAKVSRVANDYYAGERGGMFYAKLTDINDNPLANMTVQIASFGRIYTVATDEQGRAGLRISYLAANTYSYAISFQGDSKYNASPIAASKLTVTKKKTSITASSKTFKAKNKKKTISVTLKTVKNPYNKKTYLKKGKKITLKINGKTYTAKINAKGVAKFTIKLTKKGKFKALIKFAGDKTYKACSKSVLIKIK